MSCLLRQKNDKRGILCLLKASLIVLSLSLSLFLSFSLSLSLTDSLSVSKMNGIPTYVRPTDNIVLRNTRTHVGNGIIHQRRQRRKRGNGQGKREKKVYLHSYGIFIPTGRFAHKPRTNLRTFNAHLDQFHAHHAHFGCRNYSV